MAASTVNCIPECPICTEEFSTPKIILLPCDHVFCLKCITNYIGGEKCEFSCPVCDQKVTIPKEGLNVFSTNVLSLQPFINWENSDNSFVDEDDLDSKQTNNKVLEEITNCEQFVRKKIKNLEKYQAILQDSCEKLKHFCEESCSKITKQTDKIIADLREKCEKTKKDIKENFEKTDRKLTEAIANNATHIENLKTILKTEFSSLTENSKSNILHSLPKYKTLEKQCDSIKIVIPEVTYLQWTKGDVMLEDVFGSIQPQRFYIEGLDGVESPHCFRFNRNSIQEVYTDYYSKDKIVHHEVMWSCFVTKSSDGYLNVNIIPLEDDNKDLQYIDVQYDAILINSNDLHRTVIIERDYCFTPGSCDSFKVIPWSEVVIGGFVNREGQINVRFEITKLK